MSNQDDEKPLRLTKDVRKEVLSKNEGYTTRTNYEGKNFREERRYEIKDGQVQVHSIGKTSWADSRFDTTSVLDEAQEHRFLRNNIGALDTSGIERSAPRPKRASGAKGSGSSAGETSGATDESDAYIDYPIDFQDDEGDESIDGKTLIGAAVLFVGIIVARETAPHVKRLWAEHAAPRIGRASDVIRRRAT